MRKFQYLMAVPALMSATLHGTGLEKSAAQLLSALSMKSVSWRSIESYFFCIFVVHLPQRCALCWSFRIDLKSPLSLKVNKTSSLYFSTLLANLVCSFLAESAVVSESCCPKRRIALKSVNPILWYESIIVPQGRKLDRSIVGRTSGETRRWSILWFFLELVPPMTSCWCLYTSRRPHSLLRCVMLDVLTGVPSASKISLASKPRII
mmetsp:Transcript_28020/g.43277  ORF Transcript_28020/g.43277 Transcript_28020/m.43277 type:complete len:207 (+) Transcript_28020:285-905(+)